MSRELVVECVYDASPELVWRAITDAALLSEWLMATDFTPQVGSRCTFRMDPMPGFDGVIACEVLEAQPPHRLVYTWDGGGTWGRTTLTWTLTPIGARTKLTLTHHGFRGFRPFLLSVMMRSGWKSKLTHKVPALLRRLSAHSPSLSEPA